LLILQLHIQIGDETGIRSSNVSPKDKMTLHTKQTLSWVFFCYYLVESGEGVWGGGFLGRIKRRGWKDTKDIVRKRRIVVGSQNHRERERERDAYLPMQKLLLLCNL
jgi:hypothetical protein